MARRLACFTANLCGEEHCVTTQRTAVEQPSARRRAGVLLGVRLPKMSRATAHYCDWTATVVGLVESRFKLWCGSSREKNVWQVHGTCSFIKMLFFCQDILYRLFKQYDHVIMLSKNQSTHSFGSHLINLCANSCKLINHTGIKQSGQ